MPPSGRLAAYIIPGREITPAIELVTRAEALGYDSVWVTHGLGRDSFLVLQAYGAATTRIGLGNGVVPIYPRHPVVMAQEALTLNELTRERFRLGLGVSHQATMEAMLGLALSEPLETMREYVAVLRGALGAGAQFEGRHFRVHWSLGLPARPPAPPILLAALTPRMLELAGEIADGAVLWLTPPAYVREVAVPAIERGRQRAGKTLEGFEIVTAVPLAITHERTPALAAFRAELIRYLQLPFYRAMLDRAGLGDGLKAFDRDGQTPAEVAEALGAVGTVEDAQTLVHAYREAGVTLPAVRPITFPDAPWYRHTLEEAAGC